MLEDLIAAALNDCRTKANAASNVEMKRCSNRLPSRLARSRRDANCDNRGA